jgi:HlyD family secretion protein
MQTKTFFSSSVILALSSLLMLACKNKNDTSDAFGNFDVDETIISAETAGKLMFFSINEGDAVKPGQLIGAIDSTTLLLERKGIIANKALIKAQLTAINAEINVLGVQLGVVKKEFKRVLKLIEHDAATQKQLDDIDGNIAIIKSKIMAARAKKPAVSAQLEVINANIDKVDNRLKKCALINPIEGVVLSKLVETHELVAPGKPLYKVANANHIYLKAFVTGTQVSGLKLEQKVKIIVDNKKGEYRTLEGKINWISEEAEFTPKLIQTRQERVSLVYAIKIGFKNDGTIKIGMPGEVKF